MRHYAIYHNTKQRGYFCDEHEPRPPCKFFRGFTNNSWITQRMVDHRVWLICGNKTFPPEYYLYSTFIVDHRDEQKKHEFRYHVYGPEDDGSLFGRKIPLKNLPWFKGFQRSQCNFAFGPMEIKRDFLDEFLKILTRCRIR
jgi:hypothetical protein